MPALTPSWLMDFESRMQLIQTNEYAAFSKNLWWSRFMKVRPSQTKRELVAWLISTAGIDDLGEEGGNLAFEDIVSKYTEYTNRFAGRGLRVKRSQLEDLDGNGVEVAAHWSRQMGAYTAYWPQKQLVSLIQNGESNDAYDGAKFFSKSHLVNPADTAGKTFANLFTGAAASTPATDPNDAGYPGACPIDDGQTLDVALTNLSKVFAYIKSIKMPNGVDPRFLNPVAIVAPPRMQQRVVQLTNAKFIAQAASGGAGSADVEKLIASFGFVEPTIANELAGDDTTWYLACEEVTSDQLGAFLYIDREPFKVNYYTGQGGGTGVDANLNRMNELEWQLQGRNGTGYGHPYLFFKIKAS